MSLFIIYSLTSYYKDNGITQDTIVAMRRFYDCYRFAATRRWRFWSDSLSTMQKTLMDAQCLI
jgi:hypothetical protein